MHSKTISTIFSAGLVAALIATPASAIDLGFAGNGSHSGSGFTSLPTGNMGGSFGNAWQGSGNASAPVSMPTLPGSSSLATPALPSVPSAGGAAAGTGAVSGILPVASYDGGGAFSGLLSHDGGNVSAIGNVAGEGAGSYGPLGWSALGNGQLAGAVSAPAAPALPALPAVPSLPELPGAPMAAPMNVSGVVSTIASASIAPSVPGLPGLPEAPGLPALPGGFATAGALSAASVIPSGILSANASYSGSASASSNGGLALPSLPSLGVLAPPTIQTTSSESSSTSTAGNGLSIESTVEGAIDTVKATAAAAAGMNGAAVSNAVSVTPTLTAIGDGATVPSLPSFAGTMPSLALPGSSIQVTSSADASASPSSPEPSPETPAESDGTSSETETVEG